MSIRSAFRPSGALVASAVVCLSILFGCSGPFAVFPGGELEGEGRPAPEDWSFAGDYGTAQLETAAEEPYSVNIAYTVLGGRVYVNAGGTETRWVKNMNANPEVRLRVDGTLYELRAERVQDAETIREFAVAWTDQSVFRRDPTGYDELWLYRLVAR